MFKINNTNFKKYKVPLFLLCLGISGIFLFQYLTFIPEYSSAEEISTDTPVTITPTTPLAKWKDLEYMQQMSPQACNNANTGDSKTLIDSRDTSTSYTVKKLSDGKCWMIQNLRIVNKAITSADSDVTSNYTIPASSTSGWSSDVNNNSAYYNNNTTYGAYYTWYTATAGTGNSSIITNGQNASSSICPKGWRLPTGNTAGEFQALVNKGSAKVGNFALNSDSGYWFGGTANASGAAFFPAGGSVYNGPLNNAGSNGYYWSSTAQSATNAYTLNFGSGGVYPSGDGGRYVGLSVRCIAKTTSTETPIDPSEFTGSGITNPNVSVTVDKILTMKLDSSEVNIEPKNGEIMTGDFSTTVSSNGDYTLSITAAEGASTSLVNQNDDIVIAEIPTITNETPTLTPNENNWAIRLCNDINKTNCNSYKPITPYGTTNIFLNNGTPTSSTTSLFEVGIGISPSLPSGTYSTNILVIASQK